MRQTYSNILGKLTAELEDLGGTAVHLPGLPLKGERIMVRKFCRSDEDRRQSWAKFREPHLLKYNFNPRRPAENDVLYMKLRDRIRLSVDRLSGEMVGYVSLKPVKKHVGVAELGICFAADQVEKGFGTDALHLILPWASNSLGIRRIVLEVDDLNQRAIRLYQNFDFHKVSSSWKKAEKLVLETQINQHDLPAGLRWNVNHLEVLSWVMEWNTGRESSPKEAQSA